MRQPISQTEMDFLVELSFSTHPDIDIFIEDVIDHFYKKSDKERHNIFNKENNTLIDIQLNNHFSFLDQASNISINGYHLVILKDLGYNPWVVSKHNNFWERGDFSAIPYTQEMVLSQENLHKRKALQVSFKFSDIIISLWELPRNSKHIQNYLDAKARFMNNIESLFN